MDVKIGAGILLAIVGVFGGYMFGKSRCHSGHKHMHMKHPGMHHMMGHPGAYGHMGMHEMDY